MLAGLVLYLNDSSETKWTSRETKMISLVAAVSMVLLSILAGVRRSGGLRERLRSCLPTAVLAVLLFGLFAVGLDLNHPSGAVAVQVVAIGVAILVALHRIAKGYHHVFDSLAGMLLGAAIGYTVYHMSVEPLDSQAMDSPLGIASRSIISLLSVSYLLYFVLHELECAKGCTLSKLAGLEH